MVGGEYLSVETLRSIWATLEAWVLGQIKAEGALKRFLQTRAPKWHQVGRVCFHLAENKADNTRPFAFMATYSTGFGAGGKLKHLPLRAALEQYAGAKNRPALIKLLTPVQQASASLPWVNQIVESGQVYQPQAWATDAAYAFLKSVPELGSSRADGTPAELVAKTLPANRFGNNWTEAKVTAWRRSIAGL
jgi:hypothetical protein